MKYSAKFVLMVIVGLVASCSALPSRKRTAVAHAAQSVAEAYPEDNEIKVVVILEGKFIADFHDPTAPFADATAAVEIENIAANARRGYNLDAVDATPVDFAAPVPNAPVAASRNRRSIPDNSNNVELGQSADEERSADVAVKNVAAEKDEGTTEAPVPVAAPAHHLTKKTTKPAKASYNAGTKLADIPKAEVQDGTFFPITFGGTKDDAIAISTGAGEGASSNAIAYGPTLDAADAAAKLY